ncbi:hypothetical protein H072_10741 [Dactylellina haptotyla CBS 200.50]|uniref:Ino eighty subunit 1 n=1 Tax=Dactylellina haptotyla (strain CBS 200.50) TaxID=1284197 RepID=S8B9T2_DACHA|nr:hypothetical protein H072_10741 [Dactylellina haptotyla CBS 200.50]
MASPPSSVALSQATPPPSFTATNGSFRSNGHDARSGDETSPSRSPKRSHDSMMKDSMDIDYSSPSRNQPMASADSPAASVSTPRPDEKSRHGESGDGAGLETSMTSTLNQDKDTPSKDAPGTSRRNYTTSFSGAKIKHLKKADGEPLWRKDIQFDWLHAIFTDESKVFTNSYTGEKNQSFADVYIDAMARSSKTSKILRDKLMTDRPQATNMAMVCLLVNIGRMNTTLNFFPEMRAQLRTYHAIPALQTYVDPNAYKQLQDAPRLKSILKGACEDRREPTTLDGIIKSPLQPRTNPINLIFVLANYSHKVTELHFGQPRDFFDLVMRWTLSSKSRCNAFLWLMWWYLESGFTAKDAAENPFGPGLSQDMTKEPMSRRGSIASDSDAGGATKEEREKEKENNKAKHGDDDKTVPSYIDEKFKGLSIIVPDFESLTEEQAALENVDTEAEVVFGNEMKEERYRKMAELEAGIIPTKSSTTKKPKRPSKYDIEPGASFVSSPVPSTYGRFPARGRRPYDDSQLSDSDARSMSPDALASASKKGLSSRGLLSKGLAGPKLLKLSGLLPLQTDAKPGEKRPRPLTQHQLAVQEHRRQRVERQTDKMISSHYRRARRARYREGVFKRAWLRIKEMPDPFAKSDDEIDLEHPLVRIDETEEELERKEARRRRSKYNNGTSTKGPAGTVPLDDEIDDFGEEVASIAAALRRIRRRLPRWEEEDKARRKKGLTGEAEVEIGVPVNANSARNKAAAAGKKGKRKRVENDEGFGSDDGYDDEEGFEDAREGNEEDEEDDDATEEEDDDEEDDDEVDPDDMEVELL